MQVERVNVAVEVGWELMDVRVGSRPCYCLYVLSDKSETDSF